MRTIWVRCYQGDALLRCYDFGIGETLNDAAVQPPTRESLEAQAKSNLATERLAFPPYDGITLEV